MGLHARTDAAIDPVHRQPQLLGDPGHKERESIKLEQTHVEVTPLASATDPLQAGVGKYLGS